MTYDKFSIKYIIDNFFKKFADGKKVKLYLSNRMADGRGDKKLLKSVAAKLPKTNHNP